MHATVRRLGILTLTLSLPLAFAACEKVKSSSPLNPNVAGPMAGVAMPAPVPLTPANNAIIQDRDQPISVVMGNPDTNSPRPITLRFELASDGNFNNVVFSLSGLTPGPDGRTTYRLQDRLQAGRTYFLRTAAGDGANDSGWSSPTRFDVLNPIVIGVPNPKTPIGNERALNVTPELIVGNGNSTGPFTSLQYNFEVADNAAFASPFTVAVVGEGGGGETRFTMPQVPAYDRTFYWRARIFDSTTVGDWSRVETFRSPTAPPLPIPAPGGGGSGGGGGSTGPITGNWQACGSLVNDKEALVRCVHAIVQPGPSATRAFEVTKRVAWLARGEGLGLLIKNGGENIISWQGKSFAIGRVCYPDGHIWKVMTDVGEGGTNGPGWSDNDFVDKSLYVPAINPDLPEPEALEAVFSIDWDALAIELGVTPPAVANDAQRWITRF